MPNKELIEKYKNLIVASGNKDKYNRMGIYCIKLDDSIVYVGKSLNMLGRVAQHMVHLENPYCKESNAHKYKILRVAHQQGYKISFDVLCYARNKYDLAEKEAQYIEKYSPALNYQLVKSSGKGWIPNESAKTITLPQLLSLLEKKSMGMCGQSK